MVPVIMVPVGRHLVDKKLLNSKPESSRGEVPCSFREELYALELLGVHSWDNCYIQSAIK